MLDTATTRDANAKGYRGQPKNYPKQYFAEVRDLPGIAEKIPVHFQSRFLELIKETHPIEFRDILFNLLKTPAQPLLVVGNEKLLRELRGKVIRKKKRLKIAD